MPHDAIGSDNESGKHQKDVPRLHFDEELCSLFKWCKGNSLTKGNKREKMVIDELAHVSSSTVNTSIYFARAPT